MGVIGMGIGMMVVVMPVIMMPMIMMMVVPVIMMAMVMPMGMPMPVPMPVVVIMGMQRRPGQAVLLAERLVPAGGIAIALAGAVLQPAADALDMMVVAFLRHAEFRLKSQNLFAIFAQRAVHQVLPDKHFLQPVEECVDDQRMIVEIGRL